MLNLISDFRYSLYPPVYHPAECRLVHRLVFVPLPVLLDDVCAENVRKVKPPALQWDCASEIGVVIDLFRYPVFFLSAQWFSVAHFLTEHIDLAALQGTIALLQRIRQEIQYRRADLQSLCRQLCREGLLPQNPGGTLQQLPAPWQLSAEERACFAECFSGIGRAEAAQECERLGYYTARFEDYLQQARRTAQRQAGLPHRLGLAGGMMLALLFW
jgi:hypothetical protein